MRGHVTPCRPCFLLWAAVLWLLSLASGFTQTVELRPDQIFQTISPTVVTLEVDTKAKDKCVGTGFLALRPGLVVTAWHLVQDARKVSARFADGTVTEVSGLIDCDEAKDIALVRLERTNRPLAGLDTNSPPVGSRAYAVGAPRGFEFSLTEGLISQVRVLDGFRNYQVSCPISPGNSGGPVLNGRGEVLGVVAWSEKDAQNLNFATPIGYVLALDPSRPVTGWDTTHRRSSRRSRVNNRALRDTSRTHEEVGDLQTLQRLLEQSAGQKVTVVLFSDKGERTFTFTVPPSK